MMSAAATGQRRHADWLIATGVLLLLIAGWLSGLDRAKLARVWPLSGERGSLPAAQVWSDSGPLRNGANSASSLPAAST